MDRTGGPWAEGYKPHLQRRAEPPNQPDHSPEEDEGRRHGLQSAGLAIAGSVLLALRHPLGKEVLRLLHGRVPPIRIPQEEAPKLQIPAGIEIRLRVDHAERACCRLQRRGGWGAAGRGASLEEWEGSGGRDRVGGIGGEGSGAEGLEGRGW